MNNISVLIVDNYGNWTVYQHCLIGTKKNGHKKLELANLLTRPEG